MALESKEAMFNCSKLGGSAHVTWNERPHYSSRQGMKYEDTRRRESFDCDSAQACGVQDNRGGFHWEECVCPLSKR